MNLDPKLMARLQKILALADNNPNEAEAEAAMAKAQELMAEHNLTMSMVVSAGGAESETRLKSEVKLSHGNGRGAMYQYQRDLMAAIAEANFCFHLIRTVGREFNYSTSRWSAGKKMHVLIGRESNVVSATLMFDYLNETMERLVPLDGNSSRLSRSAISWKEGCANRLRDRLRSRTLDLTVKSRAEAEEKRRAAREASAAANHPSASPATTANALVILDLGDVFSTERDLNMDLYYGYEPGTTARERKERAAKREAQVQTEIHEKPMSPKEKAKAEERARKYWEREDRKEQAKWDRKDLSAYFSGQKAGDKIGLDRQVDKTETKKIGG
jgi:hypothetical protein